MAKRKVSWAKQVIWVLMQGIHWNIHWIFLLFELRTVGWHSQDDRTLVEKVKSISKPNDKVNFKIRLKQFDWAQIAFQNYSAKECEDRFNTLMKCVRPHRNLNEIAADVEITLTKSKLKKPLNSYQLFVQEQLTKVTTTGDFVSFFPMDKHFNV